jgi:hypothetical protein
MLGKTILRMVTVLTMASCFSILSSGCSKERVAQSIGAGPLQEKINEANRLRVRIELIERGETVLVLQGLNMDLDALLIDLDMQRASAKEEEQTQIDRLYQRIAALRSSYPFTNYPPGAQNISTKVSQILTNVPSNREADSSK